MPAQTSVRAAIEEADEHFGQLCNRKDATALADLYTEDATILPPGSEARHGRDAIAAFWRGAFEAGIRNVALEPLDVEEYGDNVARELGAFKLETPTGRVEGKYVVIWKRVDGEWRLDTDIWNTNA